jgi:hypothetical protein
MGCSKTSKIILETNIFVKIGSIGGDQMYIPHDPGKSGEFEKPSRFRQDRVDAVASSFCDPKRQVASRGIGENAIAYERLRSMCALASLGKPFSSRIFKDQRGIQLPSK